MAIVSKHEKVKTVLSTVKNWYMLPFDKLGFKKTVHYRFRNGTALVCRSQSTDINEACVVMSGLEYAEHLCRFSSVSDYVHVVFDLGGNIGAFPVWLQAINPDVNFNFIVFEPHPGNASYTRLNLNKNGFEAAVLYEKAIASQAGTAKLDVSRAFDAFRLDPDAKTGLDVATITIREVMEAQSITKIDFLKIDIEGGEYDLIVNGLDDFAPFVERAIIEFHFEKTSDQYQKFYSKLADHFKLDIIEDFPGGGVIYCQNKNILIHDNSLD